MQNLDEKLLLLYMLNYTLNRMTDALESVCCRRKPAVVFGCQTEYSWRFSYVYEGKELGNQARVCFHVWESIDKSFLTDCSATLALMVIDKTVYSQSISPIVSCSPTQHCYKHQIAACSVTQALNRNAHTQFSFSISSSFSHHECEI